MNLTKLRQRYLRVPPAIFEELESRHYFMPVGETDDHDSWVTARFSPHSNQDHILYMGDDPGNIGVFDVRKFHDRSIPIEERQLHFFPAHDGAVMDIVGVPHCENKIVSISGDSTVRCWDLNQNATDRKSELFYGHEGSVRSICFAPDDSNTFTTGGRDGRLKIWDMRVSQIRKKDVDCRLSTISYETAHPSNQLEKPAPGTPRSKKNHPPKYVPHSVTSVLYLDTWHIASASSNAESGIKVWDVRMPTRNGEGKAVRTFRVPTSRGQKAFGVTCLSVDRFHSRLFASCTNSTIFEYATLTDTITPVHTYTGLKINDFYTQVACSPIADVIASGSEDGRALLFDLQDQYKYMNDISYPDEIEKRRTQLPKWSLNGHQKKVQNVGWSASGRYFLTMDEGGVRVWTEPQQRKPWALNEHDKLPEEQIELGLAFEQVKQFEMTDSDAAMSCIDSISISPRLRSDSLGTSPQKARGAKRSMVPTSPFKTVESSSLLSRSPRAKMCKLSSSPSAHFPLQALSDNEQGYHTPRRLNNKIKANPFFYRHPTENLPNFVYDQFCKKMMGKSDGSDEDNQKSLSKTSRKRIEDWWQGKQQAENLSTAARRRLPSVSEFGESACSKVLSEEERNALKSPRKVILKTFGAASETPPPATPPSSNYVTPSTRSARRTIQPTPSKPSGHRPTSRNLLHYFKK